LILILKMILKKRQRP